VVNGLKGFPEAITAISPRTLSQTCIVHLLHYRLGFGSWNERKALAAALKPIYTALNTEAAEAAMKLIFLAYKQAESKWKRPPEAWQKAKSSLRFCSATAFDRPTDHPSARIRNSEQTTCRALGDRAQEEFQDRLCGNLPAWFTPLAVCEAR
jgi:transposase-like protein